MNKLFLSAGAAFLAFSLTLPAQTSTGTAPKKTSEKSIELKTASTTVTKTASGKSELTLNAGRLQHVVEELEAYYARNKSRGDGEEMPTLIWSQDTMSLAVPAPIRLGDVKPTDALALIAAAAGCRLEPIASVEPDGKGGRIIGYKFVRPEPRAMMGGYSVIGDSMSVTKAAPPRKVEATTVVPGLTGIAGGGAVRTAPAASATVTAITTAPGGTIKEIQGDVMRHELTLGDQHPRMIELKRELEAARKISEQMPVTRIYAMGGIISGERVEQESKLDTIKATLLSVIVQGGLSEKDVQLSFHSGANILVVKAPEAGQNLVEQVFAALRENAAQVKSKQ